MKVIKQESDFGTSVSLIDPEKYLCFNIGGNCDLYISFLQKRVRGKEHIFTITKENMAIYEIFDQLYKDIENINLFADDPIPSYIKSSEAKLSYLKESKKQIDNKIDGYRRYNNSNYRELFNPDTKTITWYSDETAHEVANYLKIEKKEDCFKFYFYIQPYKCGYDADFNSPNYIPIRFRNSGSRYDPFNIIFMRMFQKLKTVEDIYEFGHQIQIEEYVYQKKRKAVN